MARRADARARRSLRARSQTPATRSPPALGSGGAGAARGVATRQVPTPRARGGRRDVPPALYGGGVRRGTFPRRAPAGAAAACLSRPMARVGVRGRGLAPGAGREAARRCRADARGFGKREGSNPKPEKVCVTAAAKITPLVLMYI